MFRFVADATLGRLAKWLRIWGYNTLYNVSWDASHLVRLARAEDRILLTRDVSLAGRRGVWTLRVESEKLQDQLDELHCVLGIGPMAPFIRCPVCNDLLEQIPKDRAWGQVPPYVFATQREFRLCPSCNRFYWRGTHWERMREVVAGRR
ncbi:MAG: hypothetical protein A2Y73_04685 [Chloroflexi bacterium RBG_13_56_8]|nr:MAG: hypothetical protein A2Y73_04685 [Chloroflexi bacterium RBG_13_56_8]